MKTIETLQEIGNEVCEGCGIDSDCGIEPEECQRLRMATAILSDWVKTFLQAQKECPPEFLKSVDEHFWELI